MKVLDLIGELCKFVETHGNLEMRLQDDDCGMWPIHHVEKRTICNVFEVSVTEVCGLMIPPEEWDLGKPTPQIEEDPLPKMERALEDAHDLLQKWMSAYRDYTILANKWGAGVLASETSDFLGKVRK